MSALATPTRPRGAFDSLGGIPVNERSLLPERLFEPGGATLEGLVGEAWEELTAAGEAECLVCSATMALVGGCSNCGSELS